MLMLPGENERLTCFCFAWPEGAGWVWGGGVDTFWIAFQHSISPYIHPCVCVCVLASMCVYFHESVLPKVSCLYCTCTPKTDGGQALRNICESQYTHTHEQKKISQSWNGDSCRCTFGFNYIWIKDSVRFGCSRKVCLDKSLRYILA